MELILPYILILTYASSALTFQGGLQNPKDFPCDGLGLMDLEKIFPKDHQHKFRCIRCYCFDGKMNCNKIRVGKECSKNPTQFSMGKIIASFNSGKLSPNNYELLGLDY